MKRIRETISSRTLLLAAGFCFCLCIFELVCLPPKLEGIVISNHLENGSYLRLIASLVLSAVAVALTFCFLLITFAASWPWKIVLFLVFAFITVVEYSHYYAFARFSDFHNAAVGLFVGDSKFVVDAVRMYLNPLAFVPISLLAFCLFIRSEPRLKTTLVVAMILGTIPFFGFTSYFTRNVFYTPSTMAGARTAISFPVVWYLGTINGPRRSVHYATPRPPLNFRSDSSPANNIVLIIDESLRGDYLSVNGYPKSTTKVLERLNQQGLVTNWGIASSGSTCSAGANNLLLTGLTELPDYDFKLWQMPTIFQYARAMNYKTYYIDGQVSNIWNGKISDRSDFGEHITVDQLRPEVEHEYDIDREVARRIRAIVARSAGNFVWVNKNGVHKPYSARYPGGTSTTEEWNTMYSTTDQAELVAEYEAAIGYNSDLFFSELLREGQPQNAIFIYTSDHGQTLRENGEVASHCSTSRPEAIVPLMIISDDSRVRSADVDFKASHFNIFPTILDLMNVPREQRAEQYALSLLSATAADSRPRYYLAGDLHGAGSTKKYVFD